MTAPADGPKVPKHVLRAADRYQARLVRGERIMRDAAGRLTWPTGRPASRNTVQHMLAAGTIAELDTDLFGDPHRGQTLGMK